MKDFLLAILGCVLGLSASELAEWMPHFARRLLKRAVELQPPEVRDRLGEEWFAELSAIPGKLSPLAYATSIWWATSRRKFATDTNAWTTQCLVRLTDVTTAITFFILFWPLLVMMMVAAGLHARRNPFVSSECLVNGKKLRLYRFDAGATPFGRMMRKTSLDELPLFANLLRGDITLVGHHPRDAGDPGLRDLKPGLTAGIEAPPEGFGSRLGVTFKHIICELWRAAIVVLRG